MRKKCKAVVRIGDTDNGLFLSRKENDHAALTGLHPSTQGKVRDVYAADDRHLLIVASDRISAFDHVLPDAVPGKGSVLTRLSNFWFEKTRGLIANHIADTEPDLDGWVDDGRWRKDELALRAVLVRRAEPLPIEAIVRGCLAGSGWKEYRETGTVCGIPQPEGLVESGRLPQPIFTPSTKADAGMHDENIPFERAAALIGQEIAEKVRDVSLELYAFAARHAERRGIILADTKFEFGIREGQMILIDEIFTPDSSRFWPAESYRPGSSPPSFDKQYVRDYLEGIRWNKQPPAPRIPQEVLDKTAEKYEEALIRLTSEA